MRISLIAATIILGLVTRDIVAGQTRAANPFPTANAAPDGTPVGRATGVTYGMIFGDIRPSPEVLAEFRKGQLFWLYDPGDIEPSKITVRIVAATGRLVAGDCDFLGWDAAKNGYIRVHDQNVNHAYNELIQHKVYRVNSEGIPTEISESSIPTDLWKHPNYPDRRNECGAALKNRLSRNVGGATPSPLLPFESGVAAEDARKPQTKSQDAKAVPPTVTAVPEAPKVTLISGNQYLLVFTDEETHLLVRETMTKISEGPVVSGQSEIGRLYMSPNYMVMDANGQITIHKKTRVRH